MSAQDPNQTSTTTRAVTAGLSATGAAAGAGGLAYAAKHAISARRLGQKIPRGAKILLPLEVAGLGGELMATKILHGDVKQQKQQGAPVNKSAASQAGRRIGTAPPPDGVIDKALLGKLIKPAASAAAKPAAEDLKAIKARALGSLSTALEAKGSTFAAVKKASKTESEKARRRRKRPAVNGEPGLGVAKARRFDPEADRQRRLGTYAGLAGGGAVIAGDRAARHVSFARVPGVPHGTRQLGFKPGKGRAGLLLAGAAAGLAGLGAGAYKRGVSARNQPWT